MPVVNRHSTSSTRSTGRTTATRATGRSTSSSTTSSTRSAGQAPVASGAGKVKIPVTKVDGFAGTSWNVSNMNPSAGQTPSTVYNTGVRQAGGGYTRGKITVDAKPFDAESFALTVKTMHANNYSGLQGNDDKMTLMLQARVQDGSSEGIINLCVLKDNEPCNNKGKFDGEHHFRFKYEDINKYLSTLKPGLRLVPGARLAVGAKWASGHEWGGFGRLGDFEVPAPPAGTSIVGARAGATGASAVQQKRKAGSAADLPLDITYEMPTSLAKKSPNLFGSKVEVSSRLETELKGLIGSEGENEAAIARLYLLAQDPKELAKVLGNGFTLKPHTEWWQQHKQTGAFLESKRMKAYRDPDKLLSSGVAKTKAEAQKLAAVLANIEMGAPLPLEDKYKGTVGELRESVVSRIRSNAIAEGVHNLKPGAGVLLADIDKAQKNKPAGLIRKRIEYGLTLKSKNVNRDALEKWLRETDSLFNPAGRALKELLPKGTPDKTPVAFPMMQERHRFTLEHKGGLSIDISVDFVEVEHKGKKVKQAFVEMEIDHLYFGQGNKAGSGRATSLQTFSTESQQKAWTGKLSANATLNGLPRFHELGDLQDSSIWHTKEQKETEKAINDLFPYLFPKGAKTSPQKGVQIATTLGII